MKSFRAIFVLALTITTLAMVSGCDDDDTGPVGTSPTSGSVTLNFDHMVDNDPLALNQQIYTNAAGQSYSVTKLQYVISDVRLHRKNGSFVGMEGIHYRDAADANTRSLTMSGVTNGTYDMVSFVFGLDQNKNVRDAYAGIPEYNDFHTNLQWPCPMGPEMGYHYLKMEGLFGPTSDGYLTHTGARKFDENHATCANTPNDDFANHYFFVVTLPVSEFTIDGDAAEVTVTMNINGWYTGPLEYTLTTNGIMGNLTAQGTLRANGPSCFAAEVQ